MIYPDRIGTMCVAERFSWTAESLRACWGDVSDTFQSSCPVARLRVGPTGPGLRNRFISFARRRRLLQRLDWETLHAIELVCMEEGGSTELSEWSRMTSLMPRTQRFEIGFVSGNPRRDSTVLYSLFDRWAPVGSPEYAYQFRQQMRFCPACYASGMGYGSSRPESAYEHNMNISWWGRTVSNTPATYESGVLRDVYPRSLLSEAYLAAPVGRSGLSLREWIARDPKARGTLRPFTETLTEWRPPVEQIPSIRESLYRGGRVFYWRFFLSHHGFVKKIPEPLYRPDLSEPWEAPEPIPEIYRADYYADRDPGLIY